MTTSALAAKDLEKKESSNGKKSMFEVKSNHLAVSFKKNGGGTSLNVNGIEIYFGPSDSNMLQNRSVLSGAAVSMVPYNFNLVCDDTTCCLTTDDGVGNLVKICFPRP